MTAPATLYRFHRAYGRVAPRRGSILVVTMWIMIVLAGMVLVLARQMRVEGACTANQVAQLQADAIEQGAVQYVIAHLADTPGRVPTDVEMPCQAVRVGDGAFWIIRPDFEDDHSQGYGLTDEAAKVNLNTASTGMLSMLPDMVTDLPAAIVDWRDSDDTPGAGGAESEYYLLCNPPYQCKNAPFETVDELLLVKDCTPDVLYGEDANRNGVLDDNENDSDASDPPDNRDGVLDRGLAAYVTVWSCEPNTTATGSNRVNVNTASAQTLETALSSQLSAARVTAVSQRIRALRPFRNILDVYGRSGLSSSEWALVGESLTTRSGTNVKGLINVNTAPREVLGCLTGLDSSDVEALVAKRSDGATDLTSFIWVTQALRPEKALAIGDQITAQSWQFSADIVSVAGNGRAFRRCRVVIDATSTPARVIYRQDLTHLGWPLDEQLFAALRSGQNIDQVVSRTSVEGLSFRQ